jgi:hypothetical protein
LSQLIRLCEFFTNDKWSLLYRGSQDSFSIDELYSICDHQTNTLTLLKAKHSEFVFDGFSSVSWESNPEGEWKFDPNAFVYSLINKDKTPFKMKIIQNSKCN